jgi:hypothetical protein
MRSYNTKTNKQTNRQTLKYRYCGNEETKRSHFFRLFLIHIEKKRKYRGK